MTSTPEEMSTSTDCPVCLDKFTGTVRKEVKCQYCQYGVCVTCVKRYMLENVEDPHCMNCRRAWNRDFIDSYLSIAFRKGPLKKHREDILLDREKARLPLLQPRVEARVQAEQVTADVAVINRRIRDLEIQLARERESIFRLQRRQHRLREIAAGRAPVGTEDGGAEKKEVRQFTQKCPVDDCRGFLSTAWKCGTCQTWVCPDCLVPKGKDKDAAHTCNEDAKATAALIKKETKPCPKCGMGISKIDGCFAKDTPILLWDGHYCKAQDIKIGDTLVGDDGEPRIVEDLCSGGDEMFEVTQGKGMSYIVNSKHKLALKFSGEKSIHWSESEQAWKVRWFDRTEHVTKSKKSRVTEQTDKEEAYTLLDSCCQGLAFDEVIEIRVDDYMKLPESIKKHLMGFKSSGIHWPGKDIPLDPYIMGLWIGDGINDAMSFAINPEADPEILQYLLEWCEANQAELIHDESYRFRIRRREVGKGRLAIGRGATSAACKGCKEKKCSLCDLPENPYTNEAEVGLRHPLKEHLDKYDLPRKSKYIHDDYLMNSREVRLQLLAGLIDTDGYVGNDGKRVMISQANHNLGKQIEFLARSLGFTVHIDIVKKHQVPFPNIVGKRDYPDHYRVSISGEHLSEIPTRVARKKCVDSNSTKDELRTGISVKSVGQGTYYGWCVSGPNRRFLLADFTVVRNCDQMWCVSCQTPFSWSTGRQVFGVVHNPHYYQWLRTQNGGEAPRIAGDIPCGGLVGYYQLMQVIPQEFRREVEQIHRTTSELIDYVMPNYPRLDEVPDNGDLGVDYMLKSLDMETWKKELWKRETKREKGLDLRAPLDLFTNVSSEVLRRIAQRPSRDEFIGLLNQLRALRAYVNEEFEKIGVRYGHMSPKITECWVWDIHGSNRGEAKDSRENHERIFVDTEENRKKLNPQQTNELRRILEYSMPLENDKEGNKRYGISSSNFNIMNSVQREAIRILAGERNVVMNPPQPTPPQT